VPVNRVQQKADDHADLVDELARVVKANKPKADAPDEPDVTVEEVKYANSLRVKVVWDKWAGIDPEERGRVILNAFGKALGEKEMLRVTLALGVTKREDSRLGVP
jgi:hypothetical protein